MGTLVNSFEKHLIVLFSVILFYPAAASAQELPELSGTRTNTTSPAGDGELIDDIVVLGARDSTPLGLTVLGALGFESNFDLQILELRYGSSDVLGAELRRTNIDIDGLSGGIGQTRLRLKKDLYVGKFAVTGRASYTDQEDSYEQISIGSALRFRPIGGVTPMVEVDYISRDLEAGSTIETLAGKVVAGFSLIPGIYSEASYTFDDKIQADGALELLAVKQFSERFSAAASWQERGLVVVVLMGSF